MRRIQQLLQSLLVGLLFCSGVAVARPMEVSAETANAPSLTISQLKITASNGQFITLYNSTGTSLDMSKFQLEYFNSYDLAKATSSRLISLTGTLPSHGYYMISDDSLLLCYKMMVSSQSLGFSSTAGLIEVVSFSQSAAGGSATPSLQDYVGWSKTAVNGVSTLPSNTTASLLRQPVDTQKNPVVANPGLGSWQTVLPDPANPCGFVTYSSGSPVSVGAGMSLLPSGAEPEATILSGDPDQVVGTAASLPAVDVGLLAPRVTELLPNPAGTGNDATDEFIELYNPNGVAFDLAGFSLRVGTTSVHSFTFPTGTILPAKSYVAFYSADTNISLSNTAGQAALLDPFGNQLSVSEIYAAAKDGQAWALANGAWYWTTKMTPGSGNVVIKPPVSKKLSKSKSAKSTSTAKKASARTKTTGLRAAAVSPRSDTVPLAPIHWSALVIVGSIAVLYGAYEYRADIIDRIQRVSGNVRPGRKNRR